MALSDVESLAGPRLALERALLQNSARGRAVPDPIEFYATRTVSGVPSAVKWLRRAARI